MPPLPFRPSALPSYPSEALHGAGEQAQNRRTRTYSSYEYRTLESSRQDAEAIWLTSMNEVIAEGQPLVSIEHPPTRLACRLRDRVARREETGRHRAGAVARAAVIA
eukprot:2780652-Prymnesium_polylepis.1